MPDAYKVIIVVPAEEDLEKAYTWIRNQAPAAADRWFNGLVDAMDTLKRFPERCGLAPENRYFWSRDTPIALR